MAPPYREYIPQAPSDYVAARLARRGQQVATGLGEAAKFVLGGKLAVAQIPEPPTPRPPNIAEQTIERGLKWLEKDIEYKYPYSRKAIEAGQRPDFWKSPAFLAEQGVDTILQFAQMIGTSAAAGPGAAIGMVGTEAFGSGKRASKKRLLERGYSEQDADRISDTVGAAAAGVEGVTSLLPLKFFHMKPGASSKIWTAAAKRMAQGGGIAAAESSQEISAELGQAAAQRILEDDPSAFDGLGLRVAQAGFLGLLGGAGAGSPAMVINAIADVANLDNVRAEKFAEEVARLSADDSSRQKLEALSKKESPSRSDMKTAGIKTPMNAEQREGARQSLVEMLQPAKVVQDTEGKVVAAASPTIKESTVAPTEAIEPQATPAHPIVDVPPPAVKPEEVGEIPVEPEASEEVAIAAPPKPLRARIGKTVRREIEAPAPQAPSPPPATIVGLEKAAPIEGEIEFGEESATAKKEEGPKLRDMPEGVILPSGEQERRLTSPAQVSESETGADTPESLDPAFHGRKRRPTGLAAEEAGAAIIRIEPPESVRKFGQKVKSLVVGDEPAAIFKARVSKDARIRAQHTKVRFALYDLQRAAKGVWGTRDLTEQQDAQINAVLKGELDITALPETIRAPVANMRSHVDSLSRDLIDSGAIDGDVVETVTKNRGVYLHRSYQAFDDPNWARDVPEHVRNQAKAWLRKENPQWDDTQINHTIKAILYEAKDSGSPMAFLSNMKDRKDLSVITKRKKLPKELRALLGEYKSSTVNYIKTVSKMTQLLETHKFLSEIKEAGSGKFFFWRGAPGLDEDAMVKIAADKTNVLSPLNGAYTYPEVARELKAGLSSEMWPGWTKYLYRASALTKYSKTILSHVTHIRNFMAGPGFIMAQGHFNPLEVVRAMSTIRTNLTGKGSESEREYVIKLTKANVIGAGATSGELRDAMDRVIGSDWDEILDKRIRSIPKKLARLSEKLYQAEDDVWRVVQYELESRRYRRAHPDWTNEQVHQKAASLVGDTNPTYSNVIKAIKAIGRTPIVGTFVSFPAEIVRITGKSVAISIQELADPATRFIGAQRMAGLLGMSVAPFAISAMSRLIAGVDLEEEDDLREFVAPWDRNANYIHLGRREDGSYSVINLSYTDPFSYLRKPLIASLQNKDPVKGAMESAKEVLSPFLGPEILGQALIETLSNKRIGIRGSFIFREADKPIGKSEKIAKHLGKAFEPGSSASARRILEAIKGIEGRHLPTEVGASLTGQRAVLIDIPKSMEYKSRDFRRRIADASGLFGDLARDKKEPGDEDWRDAYRLISQRRREAYQDLHNQYHAAIRLGKGSEEIISIMRGAGVPKGDIDHIIAGTVPSYVPSDMDRIKKLLEVLPNEESTELRESYEHKIGIMAQEAGAKLKAGITNKVRERNKEIEEAGKTLKGIGVTEAHAIKSLESYWLKRDKGSAKTPGDAARLRRPKSSRSRTETKRRLHQLYRGVAITQQPAQ